MIALVAIMLMAGTVLSGCSGWIFDEPPPSAEAEAEEPVALEPEPEEAAPPVAEGPYRSPWELRFESWPMAFGFSNDEGSKVIHVFYDFTEEEEDEAEAGDEAGGDVDIDVIDEEGLYAEHFEPGNYYANTGFDPDRFSLAVGAYSEIWPIYFSKWQDESPANNGRDNSGNFDKLPGFVFAQKAWKLSRNKTYLLTDMDTLIDSMLAIFPPGWKGNTPPMAEETVASIEDYMDRGVVWAKTLAVTMDGGLIGLVLYERQGNDMLFSIVYMDDNKTLFWNNPAEYDETSTWRVDAGEEPGSFEPLLLARFDEGLMLILTWRAPEGENVVVLYEDYGAFVQSQDLVFTRYMP